MSVRINFDHPAVRDLAWVMQSPSLVSLLLPKAGSIDKECSVNPFISDSFCNAIYQANQEWLKDLDQQPRPLLEFLSKRKSSKLGYYFENLVAYWLSQNISDGYFESHVKVSTENRDIGEFDFLFRSEQKFYHWETAVKFYLYTQDQSGSVNWFGPNANDTLSGKLERMLSHQIRLSERPEAISMLSEKGSDDICASIFMKGYLFYPLDLDFSTMNWQVAGCEISSQHLKGWWSSVKLLNADMLDSLSDMALRWNILPRLEWLAPRIYSSDNGLKLLLSGAQIVELLKSEFSQSAQSRLIAGYYLNGAGQWQEESRGFVVGEFWLGV